MEIYMKKIALILLNMVSDAQSNSGCNDFDLFEVIPDVEERRAIMRKFYELNGTQEYYNETDDYKIVGDFVLELLVRDWIKNL